jgi:hypothetical protein
MYKNAVFTLQKHKELSPLLKLTSRLKSNLQTLTKTSFKSVGLITQLIRLYEISAQQPSKSHTNISDIFLEHLQVQYRSQKKPELRGEASQPWTMVCGVDTKQRY